MKKIVFLVFIFHSTLNMAQKTYLALGDSYTIGEGLDLKESWPYQLKNRLNEDGYHFCAPKIIAKTGWRTDELRDSILEKLNDQKKYDLVSLLIGVNNQYQGKSLRKYKREFKLLLKEAIKRSITAEKGVFVVSIPNYGVTPFAHEKGKTEAIADLKKYNVYAEKICKKWGVAFYDITPLTSKIGTSKDMLIEDELHPNAKQYGIWVDSFYENLLNHLKK